MAKPSDPPISGKDVLNFLEQNPDFLIEHGNTDWLFRHPHQDSGQPAPVVDLGHVMTKRAQAALRRSISVKASMVDITTANHEIQQRVHHLALLITAAASVDEVIRLVRHTLPEVLDVAAATLVVGDHLPIHGHPDVVSFDKGYLPKLTGGGELSLGQPAGLQAEVFRPVLSSAPKSVAFCFLPRYLPEQDHDMVLALAGHQADSFTEGHGTDFLEFITAMIAVALLARAQADGTEHHHG
ncbi:MAG: DUF484 family protein [Alphaproteobacteria bacterium]|nr:DUF484 family protein [Alphaproteobacteria bacterium]